MSHKIAESLLPLCRGCETPFVVAHGNSKFCSVECKNVARREAARRWREANRSLANERTARWYAANLEREREKGRSYYRKNYTQAKRMQMHGMEPIQFGLIWDAQGGRCAICDRAFAVVADAHIDHDHNCCAASTSCGNCVRGLLCRRCNLALGLLGDSPQVAALAAHYLLETRLVPNG